MRPKVLEAYRSFQESNNRFLRILADESDDGSGGRAYSAEAVDESDRFENEEDAVSRSMELGLDGDFHEDEDGMFVPGGTPQEYYEADGTPDEPDEEDEDAEASSTDPSDGPTDTPQDPDHGSPFGGDADTVQAEAVGPVSIELDPDDADTIAAESNGDGLYGVIWGAGDHDLALGGEPAGVHVPADTIPQTFDLLEQDVARRDVTIGIDHPDDDSVLAQAGLVDIGQANDVGLTADETNIVLTDSEMTNGDAQAALEAGAFDDYDFSVVADVAVETDADGNRVKNDDGRYVIAGTRINRVDIVTDGAVDAASIVRDQSNLPDLAAHAATVQEVADGPNQNPADAVDALEASASAISDIESMQNPNIDPNGVDDLDTAQDQLSAAADVIDDLQTEKAQMQAKAQAFSHVAEAQDIDLDDFDDEAEAAQAVVDQTTQELREEIAQMEANLADYDTTSEGVEARAKELAGNSPEDLRSKRGDLAYQTVQAQKREDQLGSAIAAGDQTGQSAPGAGGDDADAIAEAAMDGADIIKANAADQSPADYVREQYDVEPSNYSDGDELHASILEGGN